ncbi:MAG TPA: tripartite tricarboxylate transporter substrate binding protein [Rubrivivax sp.]|nr:tripartite tricarboxylate transporter substrate binding protein [Rubrivivax sp.]
MLPIRRLLLLAACIAAPLGALAQAFPSKPIRMIVPFPPGGATDAGGRILAQSLTARLKQPVVVENVGGANGGIGAELVAKSAPDGYTLLFTSMGTLVMNPHIYRSQKLQPERDLVPVAKVFDTPLVIEARPDRNLRTLDDIATRARGGKMTYASGGSGASSHMGAELLKFHMKVDITHIPYKGNGPALQDVLSGQVDMMVDQLASSMQHIQAGKLRAIAVTSPTRLPALPDVPSVVELGHPELQMSSWASVTAPAGTPADVVHTLSSAILASLQEPGVRQALEKSGAVVTPSGPAELKALMRDETERWGKVIRAAKISGD